jgi:hypothetical protein
MKFAHAYLNLTKQDLVIAVQVEVKLQPDVMQKWITSTEHACYIGKYHLLPMH